MRRLLLAAAFALAFGTGMAHADTVRVVQTCGDPTAIGGPLPVGSLAYETVDVNGNLCVATP